MCGAPTEVKTCAEGSEEATLFMGMRQKMEEKHGMPFEMFDIVHFTTQVVAGTNYQVKLQIGAEEWASAKIYQRLPHENAEPELTEWMAGQTIEAEISFEPTEPQEPPKLGISDRVNSGHANDLQSMGYSKAVSEKALLMSGNKGVEGAMDWITAHMDDADFEEEMFIMGEVQKPKSKMTLEEKQALAK